MGMTDTSINAFNLKIRQTPWYQEWFAQRGLNPNQVRLDDRQREELKGFIERQSGFQFPGDMKVDPAGNLNEKGGWAGLPTGVKIAIIGGAAIATGGVLGAFGGLGGAAGGGSVAGGTGAVGGAAIPTLGSTALTTGMGVAPSLAGATTIGGTIGAVGGAAIPTLGSTALTSGLGTSPSIAGSGVGGASGGGSFLNTLRQGADIGGQLAGGASRQRAEDRGAQAEYDIYRVPTQNAQQLQYAQARTGAERDRTRQIAGADMLANFKPSSDPRAQKFQNNGQLSGGQINPETLAMMRARSLKALESGSDIPPMQTIPDQPGGGKTGADHFLDALSLGSTAARGWDFAKGWF